MSEFIPKAVVSGSFDNLGYQDVRLLEEAAMFGSLHVFLWSDGLVRTLDGNYPKFPLEEREYLIQGIRYVNRVLVVNRLPDRDSLPNFDENGSTIWVVSEASNNAAKRLFCASYGLKYQVVKQASLKNIPILQSNNHQAPSQSKKVVVTGCYDWFHSGHLRFFEEASALGDLYVVVGSDKNLRLLKGEGHPMFPQGERSYLVQSIRFVNQALISSGSGWMDAEPEIAQIKPDFYVVNEDGDVPEKRKFCENREIEYVVLKRTPKEGLPQRQSTDLRGF
jgi:cytidyltransferase-like protein